jgi:hypothetical protein
MVAEFKLNLVAKTIYWDASTEAVMIQRLLDMGITVETVQCVNGRTYDES